jgi:hypothetical protein
MHADSIFDELGLVEKLVTNSRTSHREKPRSNKNIGMQSMQRIELLITEDSGKYGGGVIVHDHHGRFLAGSCH